MPALAIALDRDLDRALDRLRVRRLGERRDTGVRGALEELDVGIG
jgi:hypothetical protein